MIISYDYYQACETVVSYIKSLVFNIKHFKNINSKWKRLTFRGAQLKGLHVEIILHTVVPHKDV